MLGFDLQQLANLAQVFSLPIAIASFILQIVAWRVPQNILRPTLVKNFRRFTVILLFSAIFFWLGVQSSRLTLSSTLVRISYPWDAESVEQIVDLRGIFQNIPDNKEIWTYVFAPEAQQYFVYPVEKFSDKKWRSQGVYIGASNESGTTYKIGVITVEANDNQLLQQKQTELTVLPQSTQKYDEITVIRK